MTLRRAVAIASLGLSAVLVSACASVGGNSISGPLPEATIYLNGQKTAEKKGPTLQVLPGHTYSLSLDKTLLLGDIGGSTVTVRDKQRHKCIAQAEWVLLKADGSPLGESHKGVKTWPVSTGTASECVDGAADRVLEIPMPADVTGLSLSVTVLSARCRNASCQQAQGRRALRGVPSAANALRWIAGEVTVALAPKSVPAPTPPAPPTAKLFARATPAFLDPPPPAWGDGPWERITIWREVDARLSTDPAGGHLTYAWDLNGDGVYGGSGDASAEPYPAGSLPAGVAIVPITPAVESAASAGTAVTVGVKVTNAGGASATATIAWRPTNDTENENHLADFTLEPPVAHQGNEVALRASYYYADPPDSEHRWCVDTTGSGQYDLTWTNNGTEPQTRTFTAGAPGMRLVTGVYDYAAHIAPDCSDAASATWAMTFRQVYEAIPPARSAGARQSASSYRARSTIRLANTVTVVPAKLVGYAYTNEILRGRYAWSMPKRGGGIAQPAGLASFKAGDYVQRIDSIQLVPDSSGTTTTVTGTGTMLLRGRDGALLCASIVSTPVGTVYTFVGGRGAGGTVTGGMTAPPLDFKGTWERAAGLKIEGKVQRQTKPIAETATIAAAAGRAATPPASCAALVRHLPKAAKT